MAEPDTADLRSSFEIASQVSDSRLEFCIAAAIRDVKRKIGIDAYDQIFNATTPTVETIYDSLNLDQDATDANEKALRTADVTDAILHYAMAKVVANVNLRLRASGQVSMEQDAGSPAMTGGTQINNKYLTPAEVKTWIGQLNAEGDKLIGPYAVAQDGSTSYAFATLERV